MINVNTLFVPLTALFCHNRVVTLLAAVPATADNVTLGNPIMTKYMLNGVMEEQINKQ